MASEAQVKFTADISEIKKKLAEIEGGMKNVDKQSKTTSKGVKDSFDSMGQSADGLFSNIAKGVAAAFSINAVLSFAKASVEAFAKAEAQTNQLRFAVEKVGKMGKDVFDQLIRQSEELAKITFFDDEDIQDTQRLLVQIGLTSDEVQRLTPLILDLSVAQGEDLPTATQKAIAAINGQTRGLKDVGANFDDTGSKVGNYNELIKSLTNIQGSATEALNTTSGAMKKQAVESENLQESIGKKLAPVFTNLKDTALSALDGLLKLFGLGDKTETDAEKLKAAFQAIASGNIEAAKALTDSQITEKIKVNRETIKSLTEEYYSLLKAGGDAYSKNRVQASRGALEVENEGLKKVLDSRKELNDFNLKFPNSITGLSKAELQAQIKELENVKGVSKNIVDDLIAIRKKGLEDLAKAQEKSQADAAKKRQDQLDQEQKDWDNFIENGLKENEQFNVIDSANFKEKLAREKQAQEDFDNFIEEGLKEQEAVVNADYDRKIKALHEHEEQKRQIIQESFQLATEILSGIQELENNSFQSRQEQLNADTEAINARFDAEAAALEKKNERGAISDRLYAQQKEALDARRKKADEEQAKAQKKLQHEQAVSNKLFAILNITLSTAQAIISALALTPPNVPLSIFAGATGAIQLAVAAAAPIPAFKDGTKFLDDPKAPRGVDTILMYGNRGERIITAEDNAKHWDKYEAIETGNWHKYLEKSATAELLMNARKEHKLKEKDSFAGAVAQSLAVAAMGNPTIDFRKALNKGVVINNWDELAEILSDLQPKPVHKW